MLKSTDHVMREDQDMAAKRITVTLPGLVYEALCAERDKHAYERLSDIVRTALIERYGLNGHETNGKKDRPHD